MIGASFGRTEDNTILLKDLKTISAKHARIVYKNGK